MFEKVLGLLHSKLNHCLRCQLESHMGTGSCSFRNTTIPKYKCKRYGGIKGVEKFPLHCCATLLKNNMAVPQKLRTYHMIQQFHSWDT